MSDHEHLRPVRSDARDDHVVWKRAELRVEQGHVVPGVHERAPDRQQAERRQLLERNAAANGDMRRIEQKDAHAVTMRIACGARTPESVGAQAKAGLGLGFQPGCRSAGAGSANRWSSPPPESRSYPRCLVERWRVRLFRMSLRCCRRSSRFSARTFVADAVIWLHLPFLNTIW